MDSDTWGALAAIALGLVFVVSSVAKFARPAEWRAQASALGVPRAVAAMVPWLEVVLAGLLIGQVQRDIVAWVAVAVLVAFTVLLLVRIAQGQRPPCACFGSLSAKPIGATHILRNVALIALGVAAAVL